MKFNEENFMMKGNGTNTEGDREFPTKLVRTDDGRIIKNETKIRV